MVLTANLLVEGVDYHKYIIPYITYTHYQYLIFRYSLMSESIIVFKVSDVLDRSSIGRISCWNKEDLNRDKNGKQR